MIMKIKDTVILNAKVGRPIGGHLAWLSTETTLSLLVFAEVVARKSLCSQNTSNNF